MFRFSMRPIIVLTAANFAGLWQGMGRAETTFFIGMWHSVPMALGRERSCQSSRTLKIHSSLNLGIR